MQLVDLKKHNLPDQPGVYLFKQGRKVLYVGKATSLRDRVRSYFDNDLIVTRGPRIVDMVTKATSVAFEATPTVLEALVREAALIQKYAPKANALGKDDSSFLYVVITKEPLPRVLTERGKRIDFQRKRVADTTYTDCYGPFPSGTQLKQALRLIQRIFPFFDTLKPVGENGKHHSAHLEFNRQIKKYPKVSDAISYRQTIRYVRLLLSGRGKMLRKSLERDMREAVRLERFEEAAERKRELFALNHVQDVSLIRSEHRDLSTGSGQFASRIEAYDTAHLSGTNAIGVMVVVEYGVPIKKEYRTFNIKGVKKNDDIGSLKEVLTRRLGHPEWLYPSVIIVDGGKSQKKAGEAVLAEVGVEIPVVAVVKDERHRPREVIGAVRAHISEADAVLANAEAHRFSLARHRRARSRTMR